MCVSNYIYLIGNYQASAWSEFVLSGNEVHLSYICICYSKCPPGHNLYNGTYFQVTGTFKLPHHTSFCREILQMKRMYAWLRFIGHNQATNCMLVPVTSCHVTDLLVINIFYKEINVVIITWFIYICVCLVSHINCIIWSTVPFDFIYF